MPGTIVSMHNMGCSVIILQMNNATLLTWCQRYDKCVETMMRLGYYPRKLTEQRLCVYSLAQNRCYLCGRIYIKQLAFGV